jgi:hypothetical protein
VVGEEPAAVEDAKLEAGETVEDAAVDKVAHG